MAWTKADSRRIRGNKARMSMKTKDRSRKHECDTSTQSTDYPIPRPLGTMAHFAESRVLQMPHCHPRVRGARLRTERVREMTSVRGSDMSFNCVIRFAQGAPDGRQLERQTRHDRMSPVLGWQENCTPLLDFCDRTSDIMPLGTPRFASFQAESDDL